MEEQDRMTLDNLGGGGALELFDNSLNRVLTNIQDPNTSPTVTRKLTLTVEIKPNNNRDIAALKYHVKETLAPASPQETTVLLGMDKDKKPMISEMQSKQMIIPGIIENDKVRKIGG